MNQVHTATARLGAQAKAFCKLLILKRLNVLKVLNFVGRHFRTWWLVKSPKVVNNHQPGRLPFGRYLVDIWQLVITW
jgi:hypothetical protein